MSSSMCNSGSKGPRNTEWAARLIPGVAPHFRGNRKKPLQSLKPEFAPAPPQMQESAKVTKLSLAQTAAALLLPSPLRSRTSRNWLTLITADLAFVTLNWLFIGAVWIRLGHSVVVPVPSSFLGIALLHAALITLLGYSEGLYAENTKLRQQGRILAKSVLWATGLLGVAYCMQGAPTDVIALTFAAGTL